MKEKLKKEGFSGLEISLYEKVKKHYEKPLELWKNEDLDNFLYDSKLTSANTIQKYIHVLRTLIKFIAKEKQINYNNISPTQPPIEYIDLKKLRSKTIMSWEEFLSIKNQLLILDDEDKNYKVYNYRDVVLFELAFMGLTAQNLQYLRRENIKKFTDSKGNECLKIKLYKEIWKNKINENGKRLNKKELVDSIETGEAIITNTEIVKDVQKAIDEEYYLKLRIYSDKIIKDIISYVFSPYLIRGIDNGNTKPNMPVAQPSRLLAKALKKCTHPIIDVEHLSLEDLRRSLIIMIINNDENIRITDLKTLLSKKQEADLFWLRTVAKKLKELG